MSWFDFAILAVILISALISLVRGFVKESISLATWIAAGFIALIYHSALADMMLPHISFSLWFLDPPRLAQVIAFTLLFLTTLIIGAIINFLVSQLVSKTGLSGTDKTLGVLFGAARGALIIVILLMLISALTTWSSEQWWQESLLVDHFMGVASWIKDQLPQDVASRLSY